jgi:hypothetical protein
MSRIDVNRSFPIAAVDVAVGGFRAFVMTPATSSTRRINRRLSPIGVNVTVSKFLIR